MSNESATSRILSELELDGAPVELLGELLQASRAFQRAVDVMDEAATTNMGVNRSDGRCLDVLDERGPLSAGELAEAARLSPGAITTLVDRLEREGYVQRRRDANDRRRVLIELTPEATNASYELYGPLSEGFVWLRTLTADQIALLRDFMLVGTELNLKNAERVRALPRRADTRRRAGRPKRDT